MWLSTNYRSGLIALIRDAGSETMSSAGEFDSPHIDTGIQSEK